MSLKDNKHDTVTGINNLGTSSITVLLKTEKSHTNLNCKQTSIFDLPRCTLTLIKTYCVRLNMHFFGFN